jgi:hypothetical protein
MTVDPHTHDFAQEAFHASRMEDAVKVILMEVELSAADRAVLENAVRIARNLQKLPRTAQ